MALDNTKIKSKISLDGVLALNKLGENNHVLIRWIPAQIVYLGNEKVDALAKKEPITQMRPCLRNRFPRLGSKRKEVSKQLD